MHIVVEPSDYVLRNAGDMAMQATAVTRLAERWPEATIHVLTDTPGELPRYTAGVRPLDARGRRRWLAGTSLVDRVRFWRDRAARAEARAFQRLVSGASLVLVSGMGGITDVFTGYATGVLRTLGLAARHGVPIAMMGQGVGPLADGPVRRLAGAVLPRVDLIALREARAGGPLLAALGVSADRIVTTGDDAIEIAHRSAAAAGGTGLGVNLRRADYAEVDATLVDRLGPAIVACARRHAATPVPLPISRVAGEEDAATIATLLDQPASGFEPEPLPLSALLERVRRCRVVVTGSYHAGVFALASGIPVVAVARSAYYVDKFLGLAAQFGAGCEVVLLGEPEPAARLAAAVARAWDGAEWVRPGLLEAAARQIRLGHAAYDRVRDIVERRPPTR